jgi:hypothetical protein
LPEPLSTPVQAAWTPSAKMRTEPTVAVRSVMRTTAGSPAQQQQEEHEVKQARAGGRRACTGKTHV